MVQSSGGAHTGSYGPNASSSSDDTDTAPADSDEPAGSYGPNASSSGDDTDAAPADSNESAGGEATEPTSSASTDTRSTEATVEDVPVETPAPSVASVAPQAPAPQIGSTTGESTSSIPPTIDVIGSESAGNSHTVGALDDTTTFSATTLTSDPAGARLSIPSGAEDPDVTGSQLHTASSAENTPTFSAMQDTSLAPTPDPVEDFAIPAAVADIAVGFVAAVLSPFLAPGPAAPTQPPLMLFAALDWMRREVQRTFFNRSPNAVADVYTTSEDNDVSGNVLTNDSDADDDSLTATLVTGAAHGDVTLNPDGSFTYTPDANYSGAADTFTYEVSDESSWHLHGLLGFFSPNGGHTDTGTVTVTVTPVSDAPVAVNDQLNTNEDTPLDFTPDDLLDNDSDDDSDALTTFVQSPSNGTLTIHPDGTYTYTPDANFHGADTFSYVANDGTTSSNIATVTVTIAGVNDAPVAQPDAVYGPEDFPEFSDNVLSNDSDPDGDTLTAVLVGGPANAAAFHLGSDGSFTYTPSANFNGEDTFTYRASDGTTTSDVTVVHIYIGPSNDDVVAHDDTNTTATNMPVTGNVLTNDVAQNPDGPTEPLTVTTTGPITTTGGGSVTMASDGSYTYTAAAGYTGVDTFDYTVTDGLTSDIGQASITVTPAGQNIPPIANDDNLSTAVDTPLTIATADLFGNDEDPDGDPTQLTGEIVDLPTNGTLDLTTGIYTPNPGFTGTDSFTYRVFDGQDYSQPGTVTITVSDVIANTPPIANDDNLSTAVDTPLTIATADLFGNDEDPDGDPTQLTGEIVDLPTNGTLDLTTGIYTPNPGFTGTDSFTYRVFDGQDYSLPGTVTITVGDVVANNPPVPSYDSLATGVGVPLNINPNTLLANDYDADGDPLTITVTEQPTNGAVTTSAGGTLVYTPNAGFNGLDTFSYTVNDGTDESDNFAIVSINVGGTANTPAQASPDTLTTTIDTPLVITAEDLVNNDVDPDAGPYSLLPYAVSDPAHGTLDYNGDDGFTYTPDAGYQGTDTFLYTAYDGQADSTPTLVTINIAGQPSTNTPPVPSYDSLATGVGVPLSINPNTLLANDYDAEGDPLSIVVTQPPTNGALTTTAGGTLLYTPDAGFDGLDSFSYRVTDGTATSLNFAVATINVGGPANTAAQTTPDDLDTAIDTPLTITFADLVDNDVDPDAGPYSLLPYVVSDPAHGTLDYNGDDTFTYTPDPGYEGTDTFLYTAYDGQADSTPTTVIITVTSQM